MIKRLFHYNIDCILPVLDEWKEECNSSEFNFKINVQSTYKHLQEISSDSEAAVFGLFDDADCIGFIGVFVLQSPFSEIKIANEHMWYVLKERRGIKSIRLLKAIQKWAYVNECSHLLMNASYMASGLHDNVCRLYTSMGYIPFESTYIKALR